MLPVGIAFKVMFKYTIGVKLKPQIKRNQSLLVHATLKKIKVEVITSNVAAIITSFTVTDRSQIYANMYRLSTLNEGSHWYIGSTTIFSGIYNFLKIK
jgi:predicted Kef-type K+ transport protein